jgi:hypothetical protein
VVYRSVTIIGIGTLGGFVAESISKLEGLEKLVVVDHDIVEVKNLSNSIYRQIDVDLPKVDALKDIITNIEVDTYQIKFDEIKDHSYLPITDLVLDCRDSTYNRGSYIDARLYISSRYLIVDCRKNVQYQEQLYGKYIETLSSNDLRFASMTVAMILHSGTIKSLITLKSVQKYELDYVKKIDKCHYDVLYEDSSRDKFVNLPDKIIPILALNKRHDLNVVVGSKSLPMSQTIIPMGSLKNGTDLVANLNSVTRLPCEFKNYVVSYTKEYNQILVELIPETGAA